MVQLAGGGMRRVTKVNDHVAQVPDAGGFGAGDAVIRRSWRMIVCFRSSRAVHKVASRLVVSKVSKRYTPAVSACLIWHNLGSFRAYCSFSVLLADSMSLVTTTAPSVFAVYDRNDALSLRLPVHRQPFQLPLQLRQYVLALAWTCATSSAGLDGPRRVVSVLRVQYLQPKL